MQIITHLKRLNLCRLLFGLSLMLAAYHHQHTVAVAQAPVDIPMVSSETYQRVLEIIFPRDSGNFRDPAKEFTLTLRFTPSFEAGSQVNITKYNDGRLEVIAYTLPKRDQSIGEQLNAILAQTGRENAAEMAERLKVRRTVITDTAKLRPLLRRFANLRFTPQSDTSLTLDGTGFQLWYEAVSNQSYYSLVGGDPGQDRTDHVLVRFMNDVRQSVLR